MIHLADGSRSDFATPWGEIPAMLWPAYGQTWAMVGLVTAIVIAGGLPLGLLLHNISPQGLRPSPRIAWVPELIVNIGRSVPFLVLMVTIIPLTRLLVGTSIGIKAAVVPMSVAGIPFFARLVQNAIREVRPDVVDLGRVSGGTPLQVVWNVQIPEALPALASASTLLLIAMIEFSTIAGSLGAGGIGYLAVAYGYNRFDDHLIISTVVVLILTVQAVQLIGDRVVRKLSR